MASYGDYGYGYDDNYGYDNGASNFGGGGWGQGRGGRKRRGNFDQLQQFEQRQNRRWRNNQGGWGNQGDGWFGNDDYYGEQQWDDGDYGNYGDYGGYGDYGYNDGYGSSRKRGRFYDDDHTGGQYMERGPNSVNFYDDYDEYYGRPARGGRQQYDRNEGYDNEYGWGNRSRRRDRRRENSYRSRRQESRRTRAPRKKSDAEDAIYEKHKLVTVERVKREKIANTVHSVVTSFRDVAQVLAERQYYELHPEMKPAPEEDTADNEKNKVDAAPSDETNATSEVSQDASKEKNGNAETSTNGEADSKKETTKERKASESAAEKQAKPRFEPVIVSAIKCGESAMRILVGVNLKATVVIVAKKKPTLKLVDDVRIALHDALANDRRMKNETYQIEFDQESETLNLTLESIQDFQVVMRFTSPECSADAKQESSEEETPAEDPADVLSPESCSAALSQLRRMRFFTKRLDSSPISLTVARILLFFRTSLQGWEKLPIWLALILVDVARSTLLGDKPDEESERDLYRVDVLLLRCLEILSSGALLPESRGIKDPCEDDKDAADCVSIQEAEVITESAQFVMRRIYFGEIRSVLGFE